MSELSRITDQGRLGVATLNDEGTFKLFLKLGVIQPEIDGGYIR